MSVIPSSTRDACPGLDTPMQTGDGLVARLTPVSGTFSTGELCQVATLAARHGNGILEVSMRGNLQIRGLSAQSAPRFAQGVTAAGIVARRGIAIDISPLSGIDPAEIVNARPVAGMIRARLAETSWATRLAAKTSVVIDGGGQVTLAGLIADIRLVAQEGAEGWQLFIGGTQTGSRYVARYVGGLSGNAKAAEVVVALLKLVAAKGNTARGRDLTDADLLAISHLICTPMIPPINEHNRLPAIGLVLLKNHCYGVGLGLEFGTIGSRELIRFTELIAQSSSETGIDDPIRLAPGKAVFVVMPDLAAANTLLREAGELGLICDAGDPRLRLVTCAGAPACASAHIDTHKLAHALLRECSDLLQGATGGLCKKFSRGADPHIWL